MRFRWLLWVMTVAFLWVVIRRFNELENLTQTLAKGDWQWIGAALGLQLLSFVIYSFLNKSAFNTVDVDAPLRDLLALTYASIFVNSTAPSGGTAGAAMFIDDMRRRGQSVTRAATGGLLVLIADYGGFCILLLFGLFALFRFQSLTSYEVIASLIMFAFVGILVVALIIGMRRPLLLYRILALLERWANRVGGWFRHPELLPPEWGDRYAEELIDGAQTMVRRRLKVVRTVLLAFLYHGLNVIILYCLFFAFGLIPTIGQLIAGYTMTILFLIVSPTPNGIGIVETLMPIIYVSMGLPAPEAAVISFAFRGITFWLPLLIGFFLLRRLKMFSHSEQSVAETGQVRMVAALTALMGIINVISGTTPALRERLDWLAYFAPLSISHGGHFASVLTGFALILLALRLWHRKRNAFWLTLGVLLLSVLVHLLKGLDVEEATVAFVFALFLFSQRSHFYAVSDPPSIRHGLRVLITSVLFTLAYGMIGFYLLDRHFQTPYNLDEALNQTLDLLTKFPPQELQPITEFGRFFIRSIYAIGILTIGFGLFSLFEPIIYRVPATIAEQRRARAIVERHGRTSLARLTLLPDKLFHFTPGGSVIAYAIHRRTAIALGDPIGPQEDLLNAILDFQQFAKKNDWQIAFFQTQPMFLELYQKCGFESLLIGHEGVVDLQRSSVENSFGKSVRSSVDRLKRLGYRTQLHRPPLNDLLVDELQSISDEWLTKRQDTEKRFAFGWFDEGYIRAGAIFAVHTADNSIVAFASLLPEYQRNEIGIDLLRYRELSQPVTPSQKNGAASHSAEAAQDTMNLLLVSLLQWAKEQGYDSFNLGMSAFPDTDTPDLPSASAAGVNTGNFTQFYTFRGMHEFQKKIQTTWQPRYLVYADVANLPKLMVALNHAISGEAAMVGFLRGTVGRVRATIPTPIRGQLPERSSARKTESDQSTESS